MHLTLPWLDIQFQRQTAVESQLSPECYLDNFYVVPARKRHLAQRQCLPCNGTTFSTVPCNGRSFSVKHRRPWWHTSTAPGTCYLSGGTDTSRMFTLRCIKAGRYSRNVGCRSRGAYDWRETWRQISFPLVSHHSYLGCYPSGNNDVWRLPYLVRKFLHKIRCTTQPLVNFTPGNKAQSPSELSPEEQPSTSQVHSNGSGRKTEFVTDFVQTVAWRRDFQSTVQPRWEMRVNYYFFLVSFSIAKKQGKSPIAWWEVPSANTREYQIYVSRDFERKLCWFEC